jgi:NADP-dependent aldehyde dehydrogenase
MDDVLSVDPRTGQATEVVTQMTSPADLERRCVDALAAAPAQDRLSRTGRAALLGALACLLYTTPSPRDVEESRFT